jgi:hypothetical protein
MRLSAQDSVESKEWGRGGEATALAATVGAHAQSQRESAACTSGSLSGASAAYMSTSAAAASRGSSVAGSVLPLPAPLLSCCVELGGMEGGSESLANMWHVSVQGAVNLLPPASALAGLLLLLLGALCLVDVMAHLIRQLCCHSQQAVQCPHAAASRHLWSVVWQ